MEINAKICKEIAKKVRAENEREKELEAIGNIDKILKDCKEAAEEGYMSIRFTKIVFNKIYHKLLRPYKFKCNHSYDDDLIVSWR
jgi:hypothetical protein